jgi:sulfoxide reductase heme-binding subunit YedZ
MSNLKEITNGSTHKRLALWIIGAVFLLSISLLGVLGFYTVRFLPVGQTFTNLLSQLFSTIDTHTTWYITRSASWVAYLLLWFSMVWGLVIPTKLFERFLSPTFVVDFHEYISLLAIGFIILHIGVLLIDQYLPFTFVQIFVPFISPYRPLWVGLGVIGFYLTLLVTITFYLRKKIGQQKFKAIHTLSLVAYFGVVLHGFFSGSDSSLLTVQLIYLVTFLVVVFLSSYWLIQAKQIKKLKDERLLTSTNFQEPKLSFKEVV